MLDLREGELGIERRRRRTRLQDPEIRHWPFGPVLGKEEHAIARRDAHRRERMARSIAELSQLLVGDAIVPGPLELAGVLLAGEEAERDPFPVPVHRRVEELQEILRLRQLADVLAALLLEPGEDPLLEPLHVHVAPVEAPVDALGIPGKLLPVCGRKLLPERSRVRALEDEDLAGDEWQEQLPGHLDGGELAVDRLERLIGAGEERA